MVIIELGNVGSEEQAQKIKDAVQNQTYMNFQVEFTSYAGNWPVTVTTSFIGSDTEEEIKEMLMFTLATSL